jgi:hypothetical protein
MLASSTSSVLKSLEQDGIALLPNFLEVDQLRSMRAAFESRLQCLRLSDVDGYEKTEPFRHMVEDVLTLDQGFVDAALHPVVKETLREYLGQSYELVEAKGWKSLPTRRDFHGWHGDAWYDQKQIPYVPREVKLGVYLTDVNSGFFEYLKGTHRKEAPRQFLNKEVEHILPSQVLQVRASAGSAFLFDTSGVHRQSVPILQQRDAVFYNYHDPSIPLQEEDVKYYRYHPLLVNTAFLGNLSAEDCRILGFGNKQNYVHAFVRRPRHPRLQRMCEAALDTVIYCEKLQLRIKGRVERTLKRSS